METATDYYSLLGVKSGASPEAIKRAYRLLAHRYHPDRNPGNPQAAEKFQNLHDAYSVLADADKRASYDALLDPATAELRSGNDHRKNGNGDAFESAFSNNPQVAQDAKLKGDVQPRCPSCSVLGPEHLLLRKGGAAAGRGKQFIAAPFNIIFCDSCGHIYGVTAQTG